MRVCFSCVEIFAWGKYGGFGRATRTIGRELVRRGIDVVAVVPRQNGQGPVEKLDGITVLGFLKSAPWEAWKLYKKADADIYHSSEPSLGTYMAMRAMPYRKHLITCRDPRNWEDWRKEFQYPALNRMQVASNFLFESNFLVTKAVRHAHGVYSPAKFLIPKIKALYGLKSDPAFLPTPVYIPSVVKKSSIPTVGFLARWDRIKRPELFFELVPQFPQVRFIAGGESRNRKWDRYLRERVSHFPNLEMPGFVDQFNSKLFGEI